MEQEKKNGIFTVSLKGIVYNPKDKTFLLVNDAATETEFYKNAGPWEFPGGRIQEEEELEVALKREIGEEIGNVQFENKGVVDCSYRLFADKPWIDIYHLLYYVEGEIKISNEHVEYRWVTQENIEKGEYRDWVKEKITRAAAIVTQKSYLDDLKRIQADFDNYKKRQAAEKDEFSRYMINTIVTELVPVLDNFNMAISHVPADKKDDPWVTGMTYIEKQFEEVLSRYGVKVLEVKAGDPFDPTKHEAIEHTETEGAKSEDLIIEKVLQNGYVMGDKVVKAARVNVVNK